MKFFQYNQSSALTYLREVRPQNTPEVEGVAVCNPSSSGLPCPETARWDFVAQIKNATLIPTVLFFNKMLPLGYCRIVVY